MVIPAETLWHACLFALFMPDGEAVTSLGHLTCAFSILLEAIFSCLRSNRHRILEGLVRFCSL